VVRPGTRFGPYEVIEPIGEGGMGVVFKARDKILDRFVALKVAHQKGPQLTLDLVDEARAAAGLQHPHIVPIYHAGKMGGVLFFAMQYIEGQDIDQVVASSPPDLDQIVGWMLQIAEALHFAHVRGMVHYDVKPGNIMVDSFGRAVLLDFGLAKVYEEMRESRHENVVASPEFASPEQLARRPGDERSDIYSLGTVFYALITGRTPFSSDNVVTLVKAKLKEDPRPVNSINSEVPKEIAALIDRMVRRSPSDRPATMGEVVKVLSAYQDREAVQLSPAVTRITERIQKLPPFPQVGFTLLKEMSREDTNAERLQRIISADSVLVARILRVVNSAYYSIPNRVTTIKHSVAMLGFRQIRDLAFGIYLLELGRGFKGGGVGHPLQLRYWSHSVAVAFLSEALARFLALPTANPGEAYAAGLLHDIGLLILSRYEVQKTAEAVKLQSESRCNSLEVERELIGCTHTELAVWLAQKWSLPENLHNIAVYHHTARPESPVAELETIVRLADAIAVRNGYGFYLAHDGWELEPPLHRMLRMSNSRVPETDLIPFLEKLTGNILQQLNRYMAAFSGKPVDMRAEAAFAGIHSVSPSSAAPPPSRRKPRLFNGFRRWLHSS
jgi:putative nucleotidyltransferase with HDIG domain